MKKRMSLIIMMLLCLSVLAVTIGCSQEKITENSSLTQTTALENNRNMKTNFPILNDETTTVSSEETKPDSSTVTLSVVESQRQNPSSMVSSVISSQSSQTQLLRNSTAISAVFPADSSCNMVYYTAVRSPNLTEGRALTDQEKKKVIEILHQEIFTPVSYPWSIKLSDQSPNYCIKITRNSETYFFNLYGYLGDWGYVTIQKGGVYYHYAMPVDSYKKVLADIHETTID